MNPAAILGLLSNLYEQIVALQSEVKTLREQVADQGVKDG